MLVVENRNSPETFFDQEGKYQILYFPLFKTQDHFQTLLNK